MDEMTVFELIGTGAWVDWGSRGTETRLGLFSTVEKAEAKIEEMKKDKEWKMRWDSFRIVEIEVK
jgi:hypothetical protein